MRLFLPLLALLQVNVPQAPPPDERAVDGIVQTTMSNWEVPGCAVVVVHRGRVIYLKGHGVRRLGGNDPVTADTIFPLASCTKAFTSTLVAMLADDGKLGWDDPVRKHLPDFRLADPLADAGVALRDLLCQRTGVASHDELWYRSPLPQRELIRRVGLLPPSRPFRTAFQYQSVLYAAAGFAAESAGGAKWDDLIRQRIFGPLGMTGASCVTPGDRPALPLASPHKADATGRLAVIRWYEQKEPNPAGSVHLTARDLGPWLALQLGDGTFRGRRLVSEANLRETHSPQIVQRVEGVTAATHPDTLQMSYGLGWVIQDYRGTLLWSHTGVIDGFRAQIALAPREGLGLAVLANRHGTRMNLALINTLLDRFLALPTQHWDGHLKRVVAREDELAKDARAERDRLRDPAGKPPLPLAAFSGRYEHPAYGVMTVTIDGDGLRWEWNGLRAAMLYHHGASFDVVEPSLQEPHAEFETAGKNVRALRVFDVAFQRQDGVTPTRPPA